MIQIFLSVFKNANDKQSIIFHPLSFKSYHLSEDSWKFIKIGMSCYPEPAGKNITTTFLESSPYVYHFIYEMLMPCSRFTSSQSVISSAWGFR